MSKGSRPRPFSVSQNEYADRFDAIFKKKQEPEKDKPSENNDKEDWDSEVKDSDQGG